MQTTDISSLTNSVLLAIDKEMRKNGIHTYQMKHNEIRPTVTSLVETLLKDHIAEVVINETRLER